MIDIIAENKDYLVINKPAGLLVHKDRHNQNAETVCDFLLSKYPEIKNVGESLKIRTGDGEGNYELIERPGIVHRLDKDTSGVMIIALNQKAYDFLKNAFKKREIKKTYHAFVYENVKEDEFTISEPIGRSRINFKQWQAGKNARGKMRDAETEFKVLARANNKTFTLLEVKPKTGRTHQIRVHLKYIFKPIIADQIYAPGREPALGFERLALHSYQIQFQNPQGDQVSYEAPYPQDFQEAHRKLLLL